MTIVLVAAGGVIGVVARYALGTTVSPTALPWMTVAINIVGSFLLGVVVSLSGDLPPAVRSGLAVGVLGGFTTFSAFSLDVVRQIEAGDGGKALLYVLASVVAGVAAAAFGLYAGRLAS